MQGSLAGRMIVSTADRRKHELATALERHGAVVHQVPALRTVPVLDDAQLLVDTRSVIAAQPEIVVITTGVGLRGWISAAESAGLSSALLDTLAGARLIARGPKARGAIEGAGLKPAWVAEGEVIAEVQEMLLGENLDGLNIAVQHHGAGSDGLDEALRAAGATVLPVLVYGWGPPMNRPLHEQWADEVAGGEVDAVLFTSAPGAVAWINTITERGHLARVVDLVNEARLVLATVGPVTAQPLADAGCATIYPDRWRLGALIKLVAGHFESTRPDRVNPERS